MPWWRSALFFSGLAALILALASGIELLAGDLFSIHMLQHMLLTIVAAPLLVLGAPPRPLLRGIPAILRRGVVRPLARSHVLRWLLHLLRHPLVSVSTRSPISASGARSCGCPATRSSSSRRPVRSSSGWRPRSASNDVASRLG